MDRKKVLAIIAAISLVVGCCVMMILYPLLKGEDPFHPDPSPQQVGEAFFQALKDEDYTAAYDLCDPYLQQDLIDPSNLQYIIEVYEYFPESWDFKNESMAANQKELNGIMVFKQHGEGVFQLILRNYEDGWKIAVFHLDYN